MIRRRGATVPTRVTDLLQLDGLTTWRKMLASNKVELALPGIDSHDLQSWQRAINRDRAACGCPEGAVFFVVCEGLYAVGVLLHIVMQNTSTRLQVGVGIGIALGAAVIGKLLGLLRAKLRLRRTLRELVAAAKQSQMHIPLCQARSQGAD